MNWPDAILRFKIQKLHQEASLDNMGEGIHGKIGEFGQKWLNSHPKASLYLSGNPGSGKTYFSVALLRALLEKQPQWVIYKRSDELDSELLRAAQDGQEAYVLEKYHEVPVLFIDDLGVERVNERIIKQYFSIIDTRLGNLKTTVFSSNIPLERIKETLGDRIASRLEMTTEINFPKKDLRKSLMVTI